MISKKIIEKQINELEQIINIVNDCETITEY